MGQSCVEREYGRGGRDGASLVEEAYKFLHEHPELGKQETQAQLYLTSKFRALGFTRFETSPSAPTAVIAVLETGRPGPVVALRAEMDARPLEAGKDEPEDHQPRSLIAGRMHNCGHDVHAAMLLGAASVLKRNADRLVGTVVFVFQPAEETPGGADDLIRDGVLQRLGVQKIFAQHVAPGLPVGTVAISPGVVLAASGYFKIMLKGSGSHAAEPWRGSDVGLLATHLAQELAYLPARRLDPVSRPAIISIARLVADGGASNQLPSEAELSGTVRAFEDLETANQDRVSLSELMRSTVERFAAAHQVTATWAFRTGSPPTENSRALFDETIKPLSSVWTTGLNTTLSRGMFSEDFAFYTRHNQALYFALGVAGDSLGRAGVHTREFTIDPGTLRIGTRLMTHLGVIGSTGQARFHSE